LTANDETKLYAFSRKLGSEDVIVVINRSNKPVTFTHAALKTNNYKNLLTGLPAGKQINVEPMNVAVVSNK